MEDVGDEYFGELVSRSLFQNSGKNSSCYVMHDLVGDLARWAAGDTFCRLDDKPQGGCSPKTRYLTYISVSNGCENYLTRYATSDLVPRLKFLRVLSFKGYKLTEVPSSIVGPLSIGRLENVIDVGDAKMAQKMTKEGLDTLQLEWSGTSEKESEVLCSLEPHKKLIKLTIKGYNGFKFSKWIGHPSFSDMTFVELENCKSCRFLPPIGQLPFLKTLWIKGLASVESVGAELYGECSLPFPCLETLGFMDMPVWKK
ncbi:hypothetical protein ACLB2K_068385 [Fragaria x ananassa]